MIFTSKLSELGRHFQCTEGPVWHRDGYLLFSDIPADRILWSNGRDLIKVWRSESGHSNGLTFDREGRLIACEHGNRRVSRTEADGSVITVADQYQEKKLNSPNDCVVRSDGIIYFTDPPYGLEGRPQECPFNGVFRVSPGHEPVLLLEDMEKPNGLAFSPDEQFLYIADTSREHIRVFSVDPSGDLKEGRVFASVGRPDGMKADVDGNLYVASTEGIVVFNPGGNRLEVLAVPERPSNCAFGDRDKKTLFITARKGLYQVRTELPGINPWR